MNAEQTHPNGLDQTAGIIGPSDGAESGDASMLERLIYRYVAARVAKGELNPRSAAVVRSHLLAFAASTNAGPHRVTRRTVENWLETPGLAPAYRRTRFSSLRGFCRWCVIEGHMKRDPTLSLKTPRVPRGLPRALPLEDAVAVVAAAQDTRTRLIVSLMLQEGLRRIEVARCLYSDIDMRRGVLAVRGKGGGGDATRVVPITVETARALKNYLAEHPVTNGFLIRSHRDPHKGVSAGTISELVLRPFRESGVKARNGDGRSAHALRHTCAQDMIDGAANIRQVQAALGHATIKTTETYLRNSVGGLVEAMGGRTYATGA